MNQPIIIGFVGYKRSGKDTAAACLKAMLPSKQYPIVVRAGFADEVKAEIAEALGSTVEYIEANKTRPEVRKLLQWWGTDLRREQDSNYWIKRLENKIAAIPTLKDERHVFLVPDIRFHNEADWIRQQGGYLIKVNRAGLVNIDTHASEANVSSIHCHLHIHNDNTVLKLQHEMQWAWVDYIKPHFKL